MSNITIPRVYDPDQWEIGRAITQLATEAKAAIDAEAAARVAVGAFLPSTFLYQEGGVASGNVFTSFRAAYNAAIATGNVCQIAIDPTFGTPVTGACGLLDLSKIDLVCTAITNDAGTYTSLTFQTGTTVTKFRRVIGLTLASTSSAPIVTIGNGIFDWVILEDQAFFVGGTGSDFFQINSGGSIVCVIELSTLTNGTHRVFSVASGGNLYVYAGNLAGVGSTTIGGAGSAIVFVNSLSAVVSATQVNVSGSYTVTLNCSSSGAGYTDAAPLLGAANVQAAITALKNKGTLNSGATGARPTATVIGWSYFDTTVGKPIWWNGSVWKDAAGSTV